MDCNNSQTRKLHSGKSSTKQRHHKSTRKSKTKQNQRSPARSKKSRNTKARSKSSSRRRKGTSTDRSSTKVRSKSSSRRRKGASSDRSSESLSRLSSQKGTPYSSQESLQHFSESIDSAFDSKPSYSKFSECSGGASSDIKYLEFKRNYFPIYIVDSSPEPDVILPKPTRSKPKLVVYDSDEDFPINLVHPGTYNYRSTLEPREQSLTKTKHVCPVRNKRSEEDKVIEELINTRYSKYKVKVNKLNYERRKNYPVDIPLLDEITNNVQESCMIKSFDNFLKQPANEGYPTYVDIEQAFPKIR